jgi:hypothetical protein
MTFFRELWKQGKLAERRNPMFEKNKAAKVWIYIGVAFWACYLIFFGATFAFVFGEGGRESYQVLNSGLVFILVIDFMIRFPFQQIPTQEVKPYLLMPVRKQRVIDFLLVRSGLDLFNLFWFFFFVPFACIALFRFYGVFGIVAYLIGIWLLIIVNNYWFLLCRTLMNEHIAWLLLPAALYGGIAAALFVPKHSIVGDLCIDLGDGYIHGNILFYLATLAVIAVLWFINSRLMGSLVYKEINKVDDIKIRHLSQYSFLERFGLLGEFMRLELRLLFRNRVPKIQMRTILALVIAFALIQSFTSIYNDPFMKLFITMYAFCAVGMTMLMQIMSFEGNYIDGLMVRKECILTVLKAKYILSCLYMVVPLVILIPTMVTGKVTVLFVFSMACFSMGVVYFMLFQLVVYNTNTIPLNMKVGQRQSSSSMQKVMAFAVFIVPMALYWLLEMLCGKTVGDLILLFMGIVFILLSNVWLKNVYQRFMKRRYKNMDELRSSRMNN